VKVGLKVGSGLELSGFWKVGSGLELSGFWGGLKKAYISRPDPKQQDLTPNSGNVRPHTPNTRAASS
jgi:hypothetical protein